MSPQYRDCIAAIARWSLQDEEWIQKSNSDTIDSSQNFFQRLPLELRQQIYHECFDSAPQPGLLCTNKSIHSEATAYLRKRQQKFSFHISGQCMGFDEFSQWCFKVKGHIPRLNRIKHITLNIHPPNPDKPIEMWHIWNRVLGFCKDLAGFERIPRLSVEFVESDAVKWATDGAAQNTMQLAYAITSPYYSDVSQILAIFSRYVDNVGKADIYLPQSYISTYPSLVMHHLGYREHQMTDKLTDEKLEWHKAFSKLEKYVKLAEQPLIRDTGLKSRSKFEKLFGRRVVLDNEVFTNSARLWPHMETLDDWERPRAKRACSLYPRAVCNCNLVEVAMPDPIWVTNNQFYLARQWHRSWPDGGWTGYCARNEQRHFVPPPEELLPRWCYGEELQHRLFPDSVRQLNGRMRTHRTRKRGGVKEIGQVAVVGG